MPKVYQPPKDRKGSLTVGIAFGVGVSGLLFLAVPLTQIFNTYDRSPEFIEQLEVAPPPPPPPPEDPPPPPEDDPKDPPPELENQRPQISLDQLEMALNPGTGNSLGGDFALPSFDLSGDDLGTLDIFELSEVDAPPQPSQRIEFTYPSLAKRKGISGVVKVEYVVSERGRVEQITIVESPDPSLSEATREVLLRSRFQPARKGDQPVKVRMRAAIPYR